MIFIDNKEGLIGDFLGTIPAMQTLAKKEIVLVKIHPEASGLFQLIKSDRISRITSYSDQMNPIILSSSEAFQIAVKKNYYMTQAFMEQAGLQVPIPAPKAKLTYNEEAYLHYEHIDYLLSPFARSLPEEQKWPINKWLELVRTLPGIKFGVLGNSKYDEKNIWLNEKNVVPLYNINFKDLCSIYKKSLGLISVVTGTSHLAFHLGVKNILLTNQNMTWGNNPDAIKITDYIPDITVEQIIDKL
jgi:ADP-heptose:LPS heptosyltransferase